MATSLQGHQTVCYLVELVQSLPHPLVQRIRVLQHRSMYVGTIVYHCHSAKVYVCIAPEVLEALEAGTGVQREGRAQS